MQTNTATIACKSVTHPGTDYTRREFAIEDARGSMSFSFSGTSDQLSSFGGATWPHEHPELFAPLPASAAEGSARVRIKPEFHQRLLTMAPGARIALAPKPIDTETRDALIWLLGTAK